MAQPRGTDAVWLPSLIHTVALARWTRVNFSSSETVSTVFGSDFQESSHVFAPVGKPLKRLGAFVRGIFDHRAKAAV
jgi:hypothetical protein